MKTNFNEENNYEYEIELACNLIKNSTALLITAGAGFSVDSGIPDYYGDEGFWK
jgi:NAD-dependent SIR2 family protein deacetylase